MTKKKSGPQILVNKLSVVDAQHLYKIEGGHLSVSELLFRLASLTLVHILVARAIFLAQATIWHLVLPLVAEYFVYLITVPILQAFVRHAELKQISWQCLRILVIQLAVLIGLAFAWPLFTGQDLMQQWAWGWETAWAWVVGTQMHWPVLLAGVFAAINVKGNVDKLQKFGPPFAGPGAGCAMRAVVFFLALVIVPAAAIFLGPLVMYLFPSLEAQIKAGAIVWLVWLIFTAADFGRVYMRWDIQRRLQRVGQLPDLKQNAD